MFCTIFLRESSTGTARATLTVMDEWDYGEPCLDLVGMHTDGWAPSEFDDDCFVYGNSHLGLANVPAASPGAMSTPETAEERSTSETGMFILNAGEAGRSLEGAECLAARSFLRALGPPQEDPRTPDSCTSTPGAWQPSAAVVASAQMSCAFVMNMATARFDPTRIQAIHRVFGLVCGQETQAETAIARLNATGYADFGSCTHLGAVVSLILSISDNATLGTFDAVTHLCPERGLKRDCDDKPKHVRMARKNREGNVCGQDRLFYMAHNSVMEFTDAIESYDERTGTLVWFDMCNAIFAKAMLQRVCFLTAINASCIHTTHVFVERQMSLSPHASKIVSGVCADGSYSFGWDTTLPVVCRLLKPMLRVAATLLYAQLFPDFMNFYMNQSKLCEYMAAMTFRCFACRKQIPFQCDDDARESFIHERIVCRCGCDSAIFCSHACVNTTLLSDRGKQANIMLAQQGKRVGALTMNYLCKDSATGQSSGRHSLCPTCITAYPYGFGKQIVRLSADHEYCLVDPCASCRHVEPLPLALNPRPKVMGIIERVGLIRAYYDAHAPNAPPRPPGELPIFEDIMRQCAGDGLRKEGGTSSVGSSSLPTASPSETSQGTRARCGISGTFVNNPLWKPDRCECFEAMRSAIKPFLATLHGACLCCKTHGNRLVKSDIVPVNT